jgi:protoporphyrinogen oxidase
VAHLAPARRDSVKHVVVVGGGPAGLAAAYRLTDSPESAATVHLVERAPRLGGLAAGMQHGPFTVDFGPHRLHPVVDPVVLADLRTLLGPSLERRMRRGRIRLGDRYLPYPVGPRTLLGLGLPRLGKFALGVARARARRPAPPDSYEAALVGRVGRPLYEQFYAPYAEKVWGRPGGDIDVEQAERRVNQRGLADLLRLALGRAPGRYYLYPRAGFGRIPGAYADALATRESVRIDCSTSIDRVAWRADRVTRVGDDEPVDHLVWSAPLPELVRRLDPAPPDDVLAAAAYLTYRAVVLFYVVLQRPRVGNADTYYFPQRCYPFNRVVEQKNFSPAMVPAHQTVLGMDIACTPNDTLFAASDDALLTTVLPGLQSAGLARPGEVVECFSQRFRSAYPIYAHGAPTRFQRVVEWLHRFENLWPIGRQGLFLHNNTHHSLYMGYRAADAIRSEGRDRWRSELAEFATFRVAD